MPLNDDAVNFMKYAFAETKDLAEHFLTLVTAILVFSLTFSEKIANYNSAANSIRRTLGVAWCSFLLAIIACGIAICFIALSGGSASSNGPSELYWRLMESATNWLLSAGLLFVIGLTTLMASTLLSVWKK